MTALLLAHSTAILSAAGVFMAAVGASLPDLGTPSFWKVWGHDLLKMLTLSKTQSH